MRLYPLRPPRRSRSGSECRRSSRTTGRPSAELGDLAAEAEARYPSLPASGRRTVSWGRVRVGAVGAARISRRARVAVRLGVAVVVVLPTRNPVEMAGLRRRSIDFRRADCAGPRCGFARGPESRRVSRCSVGRRVRGRRCDDGAATVRRPSVGDDTNRPARRRTSATVSPTATTAGVAFRSFSAGLVTGGADRHRLGRVGLGRPAALRAERQAAAADLDACGRTPSRSRLRSASYIHVEGPESNREIVLMVAPIVRRRRPRIAHRRLGIIDELRRPARAPRHWGAEHLILDPVVPGAARMDTLVADVVRPLSRRLS